MTKIGANFDWQFQLPMEVGVLTTANFVGSWHCQQNWRFSNCQFCWQLALAVEHWQLAVVHWQLAVSAWQLPSKRWRLLNPIIGWLFY